jgi:hypothetical protein
MNPAGVRDGACIACHVATNTAASAIPGITAHAISATRRAAEVSRFAGRAGEMMTECMIANWATEQHATATQKIASARWLDMLNFGSRCDVERSTVAATKTRVER